MSKENDYNSNIINSNIFNLTLNGFEGPIDLLLNLARDHKIDLTKLSILPLAEQYLLFLETVLKKDIDIAAEYLVMGAWLAFLKSKLLLPTDNSDISDELNDMSDLLEFQLKRLEAMQNASRLLFDSFQLGVHFSKRPEFFKSSMPGSSEIDFKPKWSKKLLDVIHVRGLPGVNLL